MLVAGCQFDIAWEDRAANFATVRRMLEQAALPAGSLLVLPEMFGSGFTMNVAAAEEGEAREGEQFLTSLAKERRIHVLGGLVDRAPDGRGRNVAVAFDPRGREVARYAKMHPFTPGGEAVHYAAGNCPITFACAEFTLAPFVCYDLRFPEAFRIACRARANLFAVIASWPAVRESHWVTLLQARAIENQGYVIGVNRTGSDPTLSYPGRSMIIDPGGQILADAGVGESLISAELDLESLIEYRRSLPFLADMRNDLIALRGIRRLALGHGSPTTPTPNV